MFVLGAIIGTCLVLFIYYIKCTISQRNKQIYEMEYKINNLEFKLITCERTIESLKSKISASNYILMKQMGE